MKGSQLKWKADTAHADYNKAARVVNQVIKKMPAEYCPVLLKLQKNEELRINFVKNSVQKVLKHVSKLGARIAANTVNIQEKTSCVNAETDLNFFINQHRSQP